MSKSLIHSDARAVEQMHIAFATKVMDWAVFPERGVFVRPNGRSLPIPSWEPYYREDHAMEMVDKLDPKSVIFSKDEDGYWAMVLVTSSTEAVMAKGRKRARVICEAVAKARGIAVAPGMF